MDRSSRPRHRRPPPRGSRRLVRGCLPAVAGGTVSGVAGREEPPGRAGAGRGAAEGGRAGRCSRRTARAARRTAREPLPARRHGGTPGGGPNRREGPHPRQAGRVCVGRGAPGSGGSCLRRVGRIRVGRVACRRVIAHGGGPGGPPRGRAPSEDPPGRCPAATRSGPRRDGPHPRQVGRVCVGRGASVSGGVACRRVIAHGGGPGGPPRGRALSEDPPGRCPAATRSGPRRDGPHPRQVGRVCVGRGASVSGGVACRRVIAHGGGPGGPPRGRALSEDPPGRCPAATRSGPRRDGPHPRQVGRVCVGRGASVSGGVACRRVIAHGGGPGGPPRGRAPSEDPPDRCPAATRSGPAGRTASGG